MELGGAGAAGEDRLSALPDDVLVLILLKLSTADAARTSVLSRRWRHIWTLLPELTFNSLSEPHRLRDALDNHKVLLRDLLVGADGATPQSLAVWLPAAARRVSGRLLLVTLCPVEDAEEGEEATQRGAFEFPCFDKATNVSFILGHQGLAVPVTGVFACLTELRLCRVWFHGPAELGDAVSSPRCPCLQRLTIEDSRGLRDLAIHSESMLSIQLRVLPALSQLIVVATGLKELIVEACSVKSSLAADISAPLLTKLKWSGKYDPSNVHLGKMPHLQCLGTIYYLVYGFGGFSYNQSCLSFLQRFEAIKSLFLTLVYPRAQVVCSSGCKCVQLVEWETKELLLNHLEEVEIVGCRGTEHEVAFVKRLFDWGTKLKEMRVNFHRSISEVNAKDLYQTFQIFSKPAVCMKFYRYDQNHLPVLYAPKN